VSRIHGASRTEPSAQIDDLTTFTDQFLPLTPDH
jgi:hypothetical protein